MSEFKSAEEYIKSDKFKSFHKDRRAAKSKALDKAKKGEGQKGFRALQEGIDKYHGRK